MADKLDELINQLKGSTARNPESPAAAPAEPTARDGLDGLIQRLKPTTEGTPAAPPRSVDPLDDLIARVKGGAGKMAQPELVAPQPLDPEGLPETETSTLAPSPKVEGERNLWDALSGGAQRGVAQVKSTVPHLRGIAAEVSGDQEAAARFAAEGQAIEAEAPKALQEFSQIRGLNDAMYWGVEKLGEQLPVLGTAVVTGGVGALAGNLVARGLMSSTAARALLTKLGAGAGGFTGTAGMETAGIGSEIHQATGSYQPGIAIPAGLTAGTLELVMPAVVARAVLGGKQLGSTAVRAAGKGALLEAGTEGAQESVAIAARKLADPSYDVWSAESGWRLAESIAAGGLIGGGISGGAQALSRGEETPGTQRILTKKEIEAADEDEGWNLRPVEWLHRKWANYRDNPRRQLVRAMRANPELDHGEAQTLLDAVGIGWVEAGARKDQIGAIGSYIEANTPRYISPRRPMEVMTATDLEQVVATARPNEDLTKEILEVNQGSLIPGAISARLDDLPDVDSPRLYFKPGVNEATQNRIRELYKGFKQVVAGMDENQAIDTYGKLLNSGLRVIPSYGASFYYQDELKGRPVDKVPLSKRTVSGGPKAVFENSAASYIQIITLGSGKTWSNIVPEPKGLNLEKFRPGELSAVTTDLKRMGETLVAPPGVSAIERSDMISKLGERLVNPPTSLTGQTYAGMLKELFEKGWYIPPTVQDFQFYLAEGISIEDRGIDTTVWSEEKQYTPRSQAANSFLQKEYYKEQNADPKTWTGELKIDKSVDNRVFNGREIFNALKPMLETIHKKLKEMGIPPVTEIRVKNLGAGVLGQYNSGGASYGLPWIEIAPLAGPSLFHTIVHEYGHHVAAWLWRNTPVDMQQQVWAAYRRDILAMRKDEAQATRVYTQAGGQPFEIAYTRSFAEWLAEQMTRYMYMSETPVTELEKLYGLFGRATADFITSVSGEKLENRTTANIEYTKWMEWAKSVPGMKPMRKLVNELRMEEINELGLEANTAIERAILETAHLFPEGWTINLGNPGEGNIALAINNSKAVIIGLAAVRYGATGVLTHEAVHANRALFLEGEWNTLVRAAKEIKGLYGVVQREWGPFYREEAERLGVPEAGAWIRDKLEEEAVAVLMDFRSKGMPMAGPEVSLLDRFFHLIEKIASFLAGNGWHSKEAIISRFFRGEIAMRESRKGLEEIYSRWLETEEQAPATDPIDLAFEQNPSVVREPDPDKIRRVPGTDLVVHIWKERVHGKAIDAVKYRFFTGAGDKVGVVYLSHNKKGFEVDYVTVTKDFRRQGRSGQFYKYIEQELKQAMKPSGYLLADGYAMWKSRDPHQIRYHVQSDDGAWYSPNKIRQTIDMYSSLLSRGVKLRDDQAADFGEMKRMMAKVDPKAWTDPDLEKMFHIEPKEAIYGVGLQMAEQQQAFEETALTEGDTPPAGFEELMAQKINDAQETAARRNETEVQMSAAEQPEIRPMRKIVRWNQLSAEQKKLLHGVYYEADRISFFTKRWWGIHQMAWSNPHIQELRNYLSTIEAWSAETERWVSRADQTARAWDRTAKLTAAEKNGLADIFFYMTEMEYRTPQEKANKVIRQPTPAEVQAAFVRFKLGPSAQQVYDRVNGDFGAFLNEVEAISVAAIQREFAAQRVGGVPSQAEQKALNELAAEMKMMRAKPYFPMTRFGEYTLTVRDPNTRKVEAFYTFGSVRERNAYIKTAAARHSGSDLSVGRIAENAVEFMGIPGPLLRRIKATLPGITQSQKDWMDQLEHLTAPEGSFRKRWLERKGTPGYSLDAFRVYSHYFFTGARYLARLKYKDVAEDHLTALRKTIPDMAQSDKRQQIADFASEHLKYMIEGGKDWTKVKAAIAVWHLGFSPMAAAMNLTQVPMVTVPYLGRLFGPKVVNRALSSVHNALKASWDGTWRNAPWPGYERGRQELIDQGKINAGQAPELGSYATGNNLITSISGTKAQRALRKGVSGAMWMFGKAERVNRELTYAMAFKLAMENPNSQYMQDLNLEFMNEIDELRNRLQITVDEAAAIMAAREAIDKTHGIYAPWARPKFIRNPLASTVGVFFMYVQMMLYSMRNNPGGVIHLMLLLYVAGLMGLPGMDDLDKVVEAVARRIWGDGFSIKKMAREYISAVSKGTVFDEIGPDLFLHGVSRFGFGMGLLPDNWGAPRFDASANMSMGKIVPGLGKFVGTLGADPKAWDKALAEGLTDASGAGFGVMFGLMKFLASDVGSADQKKWEKAMPRALKAASKSFRYAYNGKETYTSGATFEKFDMTDPDDRATVIAQFLGATPQKLTMKWEMDAEKRETALYYRAWKRSIYEDLMHAIQVQDQPSVDATMKEVERFNDDVSRRGFDGLQIQTKNLRSSLRNRTRNMIMQEEGLPTQKGETNMYRKIEEDYPLVTRKKVK